METTERTSEQREIMKRQEDEVSLGLVSPLGNYLKAFKHVVMHRKEYAYMQRTKALQCRQNIQVYLIKRVKCKWLWL